MTLLQLFSNMVLCSGTRTCDILLRYENILEEFNQLMKLYPKDKIANGKPMKPVAKDGRAHHDHHDPLKYPLTFRNVSKVMYDNIKQYFWKDMCLFGYDTSVSPN